VSWPVHQVAGTTTRSIDAACPIATRYCGRNSPALVHGPTHAANSAAMICRAYSDPVPRLAVRRGATVPQTGRRRAPTTMCGRMSPMRVVPNRATLHGPMSATRPARMHPPLRPRKRRHRAYPTFPPRQPDPSPNQGRMFSKASARVRWCAIPASAGTSVPSVWRLRRAPPRNNSARRPPSDRLPHPANPAVVDVTKDNGASGARSTRRRS
jgi:hypothetical protein